MQTAPMRVLVRLAVPSRGRRPRAPPRERGGSMTAPIYESEGTVLQDPGHPARIRVLEVLRDGERRSPS